MRTAGVLMRVAATMIANVADTTATERPVRHLNPSEHRVGAVCIMPTVLQLVRLALPLYTGGSRDMGRILIGTATERPASKTNLNSLEFGDLLKFAAIFGPKYLGHDFKLRPAQQRARIVTRLEFKRPLASTLSTSLLP